MTFEKLVADCKKKDGQTGMLLSLIERAVREEYEENYKNHEYKFASRPRVTSKIRLQWQREAEATIVAWIEKFRHPAKYEAENPGGKPLPRSSMSPRDVVGYRSGIITAWALARKLYKERG